MQSKVSGRKSSYIDYVLLLAWMVTHQIIEGFMILVEYLLIVWTVDITTTFQIIVSRQVKMSCNLEQEYLWLEEVLGHFERLFHVWKGDNGKWTQDLEQFRAVWHLKLKPVLQFAIQDPTEVSTTVPRTMSPCIDPTNVGNYSTDRIADLWNVTLPNPADEVPIGCRLCSGLGNRSEEQVAEKWGLQVNTCRRERTYGWGLTYLRIARASWCKNHIANNSYQTYSFSCVTTKWHLVLSQLPTNSQQKLYSFSIAHSSTKRTNMLLLPLSLHICHPSFLHKYQISREKA